MSGQKSANSKWKVLVTGEHESLPTICDTPSGPKEVEWVQVPVLFFEKLPVEDEVIENLIKKPADWIFFTSPRAVQFWTEALLQLGVDMPLETQVACIGEATAKAAGLDGFTPDFYPTEPGSEKFLEEFADLLSNNTRKPTVFIPMAEGGRTLVRDKLTEMGCQVTWIALYRTLPLDGMPPQLAESLAGSDAILFTSPSSVEAVTQSLRLPQTLKVVSLGKFTAEKLEEKGVRSFELLPEGDFSRIGEVL